MPFCAGCTLEMGCDQWGFTFFCKVEIIKSYQINAFLAHLKGVITHVRWASSLADGDMGNWVHPQEAAPLVQLRQEIGNRFRSCFDSNSEIIQIEGVSRNQGP